MEGSADQRSKPGCSGRGKESNKAYSSQNRDAGRNGRASCESSGNHVTEERARHVSTRDIFKVKLTVPATEDPAEWRTFFTTVEAPLKRWYQYKNSREVNEKTMDLWDDICPFIDHLMMAATKIFIIDSEYYFKHELDLHVWKYGVYQFIVILRGGHPPRAKYKTVYKKAYSDIFGRGISHLKDLLRKVPVALKIDLGPIFQRSGFLRGGTRADELTSEENLVYKLLISLGDLYRYAFEVNKTPNDARMACDMYNAARFCDTEKSRAYNQLGVLAKALNDIIGTVYNYTRACCAPAPADGARDQLLYAYDEVYKKYNSMRHKFWYTQSKSFEDGLNARQHTSTEIWLHPTKVLNDLPRPTTAIPLTKEQHIKELSDNELFCRFSVTYAHFLGKLFTKIGTETMEHVAREAMVYFEGLLLFKSYVKFNFLMEVMGLIVFMIDYLSPPGTDGSSSSPGTVSQLKHMRDVAICVCLEMVSILTKRISSLLKLLDWENPMLYTCSAALYVWCRWVKRRSFVWSGHLKYWKLSNSLTRLQTADKQTLEFGNKCGTTFLRLHEELSVIFRRHTSVFPKLSNGSDNVCQIPFGILPELQALDKLADILLPTDFDMSQFFYDGRFSQEKAHIYLRLSKILRFGKKVFGDKKFGAKERKSSISLEDEVDKPSVAESTILRFINESLETPSSKLKSGKPDCNNARVIIRGARGNSDLGWVRTPKFSKMQTSKVYHLWTNLTAMGVKTQLIIQPFRLVLDTNCFIGQLNWVECLMKVSQYPLYVPTTVVHELRGLLKGIKSPKRGRGKLLSLDETKAKMIDQMVIAEQCSRALEFLNANRSNFAVVTVSGERFKVYNFIKQNIYDNVMSRGVHNDEKILETCRQLEGRDKKMRSLDNPLRIYRTTVLLTGDRSLRLRAFTADIPARQIEPLTRWLLKVRNGVPALVGDDEEY